MGLTNLESLDEFIAINRRNYEEYERLLAGLPGLSLIKFDARERHNFQYVVVEVEEAACGLSRDQLVQVLHAENVLARRYFYPGCHRMEPYRSCFPQAGLLLLETNRLVQRVLALPSGTAVGTAEIHTISEILRSALERADAIRARLPAALPPHTVA